MIEKISKEQFEQEYARNSLMTVDELHARGLHAEPCDCDYEKCRGWQMVNPLHHADETLEETIERLGIDDDEQ